MFARVFSTAFDSVGDWLIVAVFGGFAAWVYVTLGRRAWAAACAEAYRTDPGWRWDDLMNARPIPPDECNAAIRAREISRTLPDKWPDFMSVVRPPDTPPDDDSAADGRIRFAAEFEQRLIDLAPEIPLLPAPAAALRAILAEAAVALKNCSGLENLLPGRTPRDRAQSLVDDLVNFDFNGSRTIAILLRLDSMLQVHDDEPVSALGNARRVLVLAAAAGTEPMLMTILVEIALRLRAVAIVERTMAQCEPDPDTLLVVQHDFEAAIARPVLFDGLRGERAFCEDMARGLEEGRVKAKGLGIDPFAPVPFQKTVVVRAMLYIYNGVWSKWYWASVLRFLTYLIGIAKESADAIRDSAEDIAAYRMRMSSSVRRGTRMFDSVFVAERRSRTHLTTTVAALAAERFRLEMGHWPESIEELVTAKLLPAAPLDPFNGQPLRLRRLPDGLVIYSVGQDLVDSGGEIRIKPNDVMQPKDVGVRLWDVSRRRQPPNH